MITFSITVTDAKAAKARWGLGRHMGLTDGNGDPRDATVAEVETNWGQYLTGIWDDQDRIKRYAESDAASGGF